MWVLKGWREGCGAGARIVMGRSGWVDGSVVVMMGVALILSSSLRTGAKSFAAVSLFEDLGCVWRAWLWFAYISSSWVAWRRGSSWDTPDLLCSALWESTGPSAVGPGSLVDR